MAIYKNREVTILGPNTMANTPESINVSYKDGTHENVSVSSVSFTQEEKDALIKKHSRKYDNVKVATAEDVSAVRVGVTPPSDSSYKDHAKVEAQHQKQVELTQKNAALAKTEADKAIAEESKSTTSPLVTHPVTHVAPATHTWSKDTK